MGKGAPAWAKSKRNRKTLPQFIAVAPIELFQREEEPIMEPEMEVFPAETIIEIPKPEVLAELPRELMIIEKIIKEMGDATEENKDEIGELISKAYDGGFSVKEISKAMQKGIECWSSKERR